MEPDATTHQHSEAAPTTSTPTDIILSLPNELATEILSKLPIKSLLQLKTISKPWRNLISSPSFTKTHLSKSMEDPNYTLHHVIFSDLDPHFSLKQFPLPSLIDNPPPGNAWDLDYPMKHQYKSLCIVGSVNGLVCLAIDEKHMFLWNPSLRKSQKLPSLDVKLKPRTSMKYGFGHDSSTDDYKVVRIFCVWKNACFYETLVRVYSRNSHSWKIIEGFKGGLPLEQSGKFFNGKLHWYVRHEYSVGHGYELVYKWKLVSLDLGTEAYGEVELPEYGEGEFEFVEVDVFGGWISLLCHQKSFADIWVMKEYGMRESWTKFVTISYLNYPREPSYHQPLYLLRNGQILLYVRSIPSVFLLYDIRDDTRRYPKINNYSDSLEASIYIESLVSPAADAGG